MEVQVYKEGVATAILQRVRVADRWWARLRGLLGTMCLDDSSGLLLKPCRAIHTWWMHYSLDVVFLDHGGMVVAIEEQIPPWSYASGGMNAYSTLELSSGAIKRLNIRVGDVMRMFESK